VNPKLRLCKDCGNQISKRADACPHCGAKIKRTSFLALIGAVFGALFLIVFIGGLVMEASGPSAPGPHTAAPATHKLLNASISTSALELQVHNGDTFDWHDTEIYLNGRPPFTYHYKLGTLTSGESVTIPLISFDDDGKRFQPTEYKVTVIWIGGGGFDYRSFGE
jgi:hypothetical protein